MSRTIAVSLGAAAALLVAVGAVLLIVPFANPPDQAPQPGAPGLGTTVPTAEATPEPSRADPVDTSATAGDCTLTLRHLDRDRAFTYDWSVSGLEPGSVFPTIEFRQGESVIVTVGRNDDPEARVSGTGTARAGVSLDDSAIPSGSGEFVAEVLEPAQCENVRVTFDPFEFRD